MKIQAVSQTNNTSFGAIKLGQGGAKRLAETLPVNEAKKLIHNNIFGDCDILVTENSAEILTPDKNFILRVVDKIAGGANSTDIEVFEHGKRNIFMLDQALPESEINKYGHQNRDISLAEAMTKIINKRYDWKKYMRGGDVVQPTSEISPKLARAIKEIEQYNENVYKF